MKGGVACSVLHSVYPTCLSWFFWVKTIDPVHFSRTLTPGSFLQLLVHILIRFLLESLHFCIK